MKKKTLLLLLFICILGFVSCNEYGVINAVYTDNLLHQDICRVGNTYFKTLQDAVDYIVSRGQSKALSTISQDDTIHLVVDVTESYPLSKRSGFSVPASYTEDICMDFGDHSYFFSNDKDVDHFFSVNGGQNIIIQNGISVILEDSAPDPMALFINSDVVTIQNHTIDDRRVKPKALEVGEKGKVVVTGESNKTKLKGDVVVQKNTETTEPSLTISGGTLEISTADISGKVKIEGSDTRTKIGELVLETGSDVSVTDGNLSVDEAEKKSGSGFDISGGTVEAPHKLDTIITEAIGTDDDKVTFEHYHLWGVNGTETFTKTNEEKMPDATCTEDGVLRTYYTCDTCLQNGYADTVIPAYGHQYEEDNWSYSEYEHWHVCTVCEKLVGMADHVMSTKVEDNKEIEYCTSCGYQKATPIYGGAGGLDIEVVPVPTVSGTLKKTKTQGELKWTLSVESEDPNASSYTYKWYVDHVLDSSATTSTYVFIPSDDWKSYEICCVFSYEGATGSDSTVIKTWDKE